MKFVVRLLLSLGIGGFFVWLVLRNMDTAEVARHLADVSLGAVLAYYGTQVFVHLFRSWRWEFLLRPIGVSVPLPRLVAISSVGFMAILALPVRLGEFVRPYYVKRLGHTRMSPVLGTVAVERIIDGLLISILFFVSYAISAGDSYPPGLRIGAWVSLLGFVGLTVFLLCALKWRDATVNLALRVSLLRTLSPRLADRVGDKVRAVISGFEVLRDPRNLIPFLVQSVLYWGCNGVGMWVLARMMGLPVSLGAAFVAMAFTGVVISLPNPPGNIGAFHWGVTLALMAYLPKGSKSQVLAYAIVLHAIQSLWYVLVGFLALPLTGEKGGLAAAVRDSNAAAADASADEAGTSQEAATA